MEADKDKGDEADIEALLLEEDVSLDSPSTAPAGLPHPPTQRSEGLTGLRQSATDQSGASQHNSSSGLPLDIAAILDMVNLSGQQPQASVSSGISAASVIGAKPEAPTSTPGESAPTANPAKSATNTVEDSSSDSSSSDWDSSSSSGDDDENQPRATNRPTLPSKFLNSDDEDDEGGGKSTSAPLKTTNEVVDPEVAPPAIEKVGDDEVLEVIGEVMSVIGSVVVVKGLPGSAAEKVLDTGSLLVWDDRTVVGEIFETFGPTHLPLYSIRLPTTPPKSTYTLTRKVYHVPARSNYVFTRALAHLRGSDASNQHDEEVGDDEVEFSDDEKEAEWKRAKKMGKRQSSVRPTPRAGDDGDWEYSSPLAYYDPVAGGAVSGSSSTGPPAPRRAAPGPYDEDMGLPYEDDQDETMSVTSSIPDSGASRGRGFNRGRGGRGRGARDRGRGRGRGGRGGFRGGMPPPPPPAPSSFNHSTSPQDEYDPRTSSSSDMFSNNSAFSFSVPQQQQQQQQQFGFQDNNNAMMMMSSNFEMTTGNMPHFNPNFFPGMMMGMGMGGFGGPMNMGMGWNNNFGGQMGGQGYPPNGGYWPEQEEGQGRGSER